MATTREQEIAEEPLFTNALKAQAAGNYLGDREVVEAILRYIVGKYFDRIKAKDVPDTRLRLLKEATRESVPIFLGDDKKYVPLRNWNQRGAIDAFLAKWTGSSETDPELRVTHAILKMIQELQDLAEYAATDGVLEEQWNWQVGAILNKYTSLFMGIDLPTQATMEIYSKEPPEQEEQDE